jgi:hypothetical protein
VRISVPRFIVISGGEVGAGYVRQLLRAGAAGRLDTRRIDVVDRDASCRAAALADGERVRLHVEDWAAWLDRHLAVASPEDHLVPYHWAPHLFLGWLEGEVRRAGGAVSRAGGLAPRGLPYEGDTRDGARALSYADWVCPPTCIEPAACPHTRGPRDWSLAEDLEAAVPADALEDCVVFRCLHLVYGVGTVPVAAILAARDTMLRGLRAGARRYLVATSSHCHALATAVHVGPPPASPPPALD